MAELPAALDFTEHVSEVTPGTEEETDVHHVLQEAHLDRDFSSKWMPAKIQLIQNTTLQVQYEEKKQDMLVRGRREDELVDSYGFAVENCLPRLELIPCIGLQARDSEYNALGYNRMGVYLSRHADVCLQHALIKHSGDDVMRLVIYKYIPGRRTTAIPRVASAAEFIEPTQGFDSHVSVIPPGPGESLQNQFDRSQVYLYEINKLLQPCSQPRQVQPYAIVSYTVAGQYVPAIDAQATTAEKLACNPRLQHIVNDINSKSGSSEDKSPGAPTTAIPVGMETKVLGSPKPSVVIPGGVSNGLSVGLSPGLSPALSPGLSPVGSTGQTSSCASRSSHSPSPEVDGNQSLLRVISQINARLQAEERNLKVGSHLVSGSGSTAGHAVSSALSVTPPSGQVLAPPSGPPPPPVLRGLPQTAVTQNGLLPSPSHHHPQHFTHIPKLGGLGIPTTCMLPPSLAHSSPLASRSVTPEVPTAMLHGNGSTPLTLPAHTMQNLISHGYLGGSPAAFPGLPWPGKDVLKFDYGHPAMMAATMAPPTLPATQLVAYPSPTLFLNQPMKRPLAAEPYRADDKRVKYY